MLDVMKRKGLQANRWDVRQELGYRTHEQSVVMLDVHQVP